MAGLWDRVVVTGDEQQDRVSVHLITAGLKGHAAGIFTANQVRDALNSHLRNPLTSAEEADLVAIANQIDGLPNATEKLVYVVGKLEPLMLTAETGDIGETKWRNDLGIS